MLIISGEVMLQSLAKEVTFIFHTAAALENLLLCELEAPLNKHVTAFLFKTSLHVFVLFLNPYLKSQGTTFLWIPSDVDAPSPAESV